MQIKKRQRGRRIGNALLQERQTDAEPVTLINGVETRLGYDHAAEILSGGGGVRLVTGQTAYAH